MSARRLSRSKQGGAFVKKTRKMAYVPPRIVGRNNIHPC